MNEKLTVIEDASFGYGYTYRLHKEATVTPKTIQYGKYGIKHRRTSQIWAVATPELIKEAMEINEMQNQVHIRARAFREKLKDLMP